MAQDIGLISRGGNAFAFLPVCCSIDHCRCAGRDGIRCKTHGKEDRSVADLISIIVTTFDRPDALDVVLRSLSRQSDRDVEVIVADDGSGPETAANAGTAPSRAIR